MIKSKFKPKYSIKHKPKNKLIVFVGKTYEQVKKFKTINEDNILIVKTNITLDSFRNTKPQKYYQVWYKII